MPFEFKCRDHDDFEATALEPVLDHLHISHDSLRYDIARDTGVVTQRFVSQAEAQGHKPMNVFACRSCGTLVSTRADNPAPYCDKCVKVGS